MTPSTIKPLKHRLRTVSATALLALTVILTACGGGGGGGGAPVPAGLTPFLATQLTTGSSYTCALLDTGQVKCWGINSLGQLGLGDTNRRGIVPAQMGDNLPAIDFGTGRTATQIAAGSSHTCALLDTGQVKCWGRNDEGQLGLGDLNNRGGQAGEMGDVLPAIDLGPGRTATQIAVGQSHTCTLLDTGQVKCWGANDSGALGLGDTNTRGDQAGEMGVDLPAVDLGLGLTATQIAVGSDGYTCAQLNTGQVKCWGSNGNGQLGLGDTLTRGDQAGEMGDALPAVDLGNNPPGSANQLTATQITAGTLHACTRLDTGQVKCWGGNSFGQLGLGDTGRRGFAPGQMGDNLPAIDLGPGRTAIQITAADSSNGSNTCALLDTGQVKCWGRNNVGQLGLGDTLTRGDGLDALGNSEMGDNLPAVDLGTGRTATQIVVAGGNFHTCALLDSGQVKCWGANGVGQLGLGDTLTRGDGPDQMGDALPAVDLGTR